MSELEERERSNPDKAITIGVKPGITEYNSGSGGKAAREDGLISAGIDWFSVTTKLDETGETWYKAFCKYRGRYPLLIEDWYHQGGYRGQKCVGVSYGESKRYGFIFKATGSAAGEVITWMSFAKKRDFRVTRIDLRMDVLLNVRDERVASRIFYANVESKRPRFKLVRATEGGGETVYIGSPQSSSSVRIYDKGAERGSAAGIKWRYEVIYRKPVADEVYDGYREASIDDNAVGFIKDNIGSWLKARGVAAPWPYSTVEVPVIVKELTPWENKLNWLRKSVSKTVQLLVEAGYEEEVRKALGL